MDGNSEVITEVPGQPSGLGWMPDGTMLKRLDTSKINQLGWKAKVDIKDGLKKTIKGFKSSLKN